MQSLGRINRIPVSLPATPVPQTKGIADIFNRVNWFRHELPTFKARLVTIIVGIAGVAVIYFLYRRANHPLHKKEDSETNSSSRRAPSSDLPKEPPSKVVYPMVKLLEQIRKFQYYDPQKEHARIQALIKEIGNGNAAKASEEIMNIWESFYRFELDAQKITNCFKANAVETDQAKKQALLTNLYDAINKTFTLDPPSLGVRLNKILGLNVESDILCHLRSMIQDNSYQADQDLNYSIQCFRADYFEAAQLLKPYRG
jgi:hypothetical protein